MTILEEAEQIINGPRRESYGPVERELLRRRRISKALKGREHSLVHRQRIGHAQRGRAMPSITKERIRKTLTGYKHSEETRAKLRILHGGQNNRFLGTHQSEATKQKIRLKRLGQKVSLEVRRKISEALKGEKCHLWKGGLTPLNIAARSSLEMKLWKYSVFKRDAYKCRCCDTPKVIQAHHIRNFSSNPDLRYVLTNGITLCKPCHKHFHHVYGVKNNTREQLTEFIKQYAIDTGRSQVNN